MHTWALVGGTHESDRGVLHGLVVGWVVADSLAFNGGAQVTVSELVTAISKKVRRQDEGGGWC